MKQSGVTISLVMVVLGSVIAAGCRRDPATPEARRAKAETLLKTMSATLAGAQSLTVDTDEIAERVRSNGQKVTEQGARHIAIRRPDAAYYKMTSNLKDNEAWYDGKRLTIVMHKDKAWARGPMPATLDAALDFMATEYAINMVSADLFYSNPYDSYAASDSVGGWVGREAIDGATCHHLSFDASEVDWELWVADTPQALPCRTKITYLKDEGQPTSQVTFKNWNLAPTLAADAFSAKIGSGYERLYLVRAPTAEPVTSATTEQPAEAATTGKPQ